MKLRSFAFSRAMMMAWVTLIISFLLTFLLWRHSKIDSEKDARRHFDHRVSEIRLELQQRMLAYEQVLRGAAGLFAASQEVDREEWKTYVDNLRIDMAYPGIQGIGFSKVIAPEEKAAHVKKIRSEGFTAYKVWPEGERSIFTSIIYLEPFKERNLRAFGYDMFSEPVRREAMEAARDTNSVVITQRVKLVQETSEAVQMGFLMYYPIYRKDMPITTIQERRAALDGFVYSPFRMNDLMQGILGTDLPDIDFEIYDGTELKRDKLMYDSDGIYAGDLSSVYSSKINVYFNGKIWALYFTPLSIFKSEIIEHKAPVIVLAAGSLISLLFFAIACTLAYSRVKENDLNKDLIDEISERKKIEEDLRKAQIELEERVHARTAELLLANEVLNADILERKRLEGEKYLMQAHLFQTQKNEIIGKLAGGVAHDFNNIMTTIKSLSNLAEKEPNYSGALKKYFEQIKASVARANNLTRQLLIFSRNQPTRLAPLDINEAAGDLLKVLNNIIAENITIKTSFAPDIWSVMADRGNIEHLIINLVLNSTDALPEGGEISITTSNVEFDKDTYNESGLKGKFVRLIIEDNGTGMDKETCSRLFEPFFTSKEAGVNIGLGLPVVQNIVKEHKGEITYVSEPGQGTTFIIYLPSTGEALKPRQYGKVLPSVNICGDKERILLIEDEKLLRRSVAIVLMKNGYNVFEAGSAKEAKDIFEREGGMFDLVFSDIVLKDYSGVELIEELLAKKPELKVVFASGYMDIESQWPFIKEKGFRFLQKPYEIPDLLGVIKAVITDINQN